MTPYRFAVDLPLDTTKGPNKSTPVWEKGASPVVLADGRLAIFWESGNFRDFRQITQFQMTLRTAALAWITQKRSLRAEST